MKHKVLTNFLSLSLLQGVNYLLPLLTLPYLVRVLGVEYFGLVAFVMAFVGYFNILVDFGFNLSAGKEIATFQEDKTKLQEIFSSVMTIKLLLVGFSLSLLSLIIFSFETFAPYWAVYYMGFGFVVGQMLLATWFFVGLQEMRYIVILNIVSKTLFTIAIFVWVSQKEDYYLVPFFSSAGFIVVGIASQMIIRYRYAIKFKAQSTQTLRHYTKQSWELFTSNVAISLYTLSTPFLLGLFTNTTVVGYYAAAEKIIHAAKALMGPLGQALYPHMVTLVNRSKEEALGFIRQIIFSVVVLSCLVAGVIFVFAPYIVDLLLGEGYSSSTLLMQLLSPLIIIVPLSHLLGVQIMIPLGYKKAFASIVGAGSLVYLLIAAPLMLNYGAVGASICVVTTETIIALSMALFVRRV